MKRILSIAAMLVFGLSTAYAVEKVDKEAGDGGSGDGTQQQQSGGWDSEKNLACTVTMCMANPAGPTAVSECMGPIREWHERVAKHKKLPSCPDGSSSDDGGEGGGGGGDKKGGGGKPRQQQQ